MFKEGKDIFCYRKIGAEIASTSMAEHKHMSSNGFVVEMVQGDADFLSIRRGWTSTRVLPKTPKDTEKITEILRGHNFTEKIDP